jgi:hypothetical protein
VCLVERKENELQFSFFLQGTYPAHTEIQRAVLARKEDHRMKNSQKNRKRFAAVAQNKATKAQKRDRKGRAANEPKSFTRAQAIRRVQELSDPEIIGRFAKEHPNYHVRARAESKLRAIANAEARILPGDLLPVEVDSVAPVGCGDALYDDVPLPSCLHESALAEVCAELVSDEPDFSDCLTIKSVRERLVGVTDKAVRAAGNARISAMRASNAARKAGKAA